MLPMIIEEQGFSTAFAFVITGANADTIDISPIAFRLGMNVGVAVHFRCGRLKNPGPKSLSKTEHVDGSVNVDLGGLHGVILIMDRRSGTGQVKNFIHLQIKGKGYIVSDQFEIGIIEKVYNVALGPGIKIIHTNNITPLI